MKSLFTCTMIFILMISLPCPGADMGIKNAHTTMGLGYFMIGGHQLDMDKFNEKLVAAGYPEFSENFIDIGGAGYAVINKLLIGGEGVAVFRDAENKGQTEIQLAGGYGMFNIGYALFSSKTFRIYPMLGLGYGGMIFSAINESEMPTFDQLLENPNRNLEMESDSFVMSLSVGADFLQILEENEYGFGGLVFGVRAGYLYCPFEGDWKINEEDVPGGPDLNFTGPFIRLCIGGGGGSIR